MNTGANFPEIVVLDDRTGRFHLEKSHTTLGNPLASVLDVIAKARIVLRQVERAFAHRLTTALNAPLEPSGIARRAMTEVLCRVKTHRTAARSAGGCLLVLFAPVVIAAQETLSPKPWSVETIHGPALKFNLTVDEGTWMSVDVSPDGRTLVFDLLGDLYTVPIGGGKAERFTNGAHWDATPRYSPDGKRVLFASDRSGSDQLWTISAQGGAPTQITQEGQYQYRKPVWDPSGSAVFALRESMLPYSPTDFVMLSLGGTQENAVAGGGVRGLVTSADGRWLYHDYAPLTYIYSGSGETRIVRIDRRSQEKVTAVSGYELLSSPAISNNGQWLAFSATIDGKPRLVLRNLESGTDRVLYSGLYDAPGDVIETGALPDFAFTPDSQSIAFAANGKIRRAAVISGEVTVIPFTAEIDQSVTKKITVRHALADGPFSPKVLRWVQRLNADRLVVHAAGKLYRYQISSRRATPVAPGPGLQYAPALSPDGAWIAYVDWTDAGGGRLMKISAAGGSAMPFGVRPGRFQSIAWSPDGQKLAIAEQRLEPDGITEQGYQLHWLEAEGGESLHFVTDVAPRENYRKPPQRPTFDATGRRIFYTEPSSEAPGTAGAQIGSAPSLCSISLTGRDRRCSADFKGADQLMPSPDGQWVAFTKMQNVYLTRLPQQSRQPIDVNTSAGTFPVYLLGSQGDFLYWRDGGRQLLWAWGQKLYEVEVASAATGKKVTPQTTTVSFRLPRARTKGQLLLKNARIVTMKGDEVLERGDILIADGRIAAVGRSQQLAVPVGVAAMDLAGKTILPGFIDLHAHYSDGARAWRGDLHFEQDPYLLANLAYGVTTWREPSSRMLFALAERVEAGTMTGPRLHGTGDYFHFDDSSCCGLPKSLADARRIVRNHKALGATSIKMASVSRRDHTQWIIQASREEGLQVAVHPAYETRRELQAMLDGATTFEHLYSGLPMKKDVIELFVRTGTYLVPTLTLYGFDRYFSTTMNPHDNAKLRRFVPHMSLDRKIHEYNRQLMPHEVPIWLGESMRDLVRAGGKVGMGSHGEMPGLGAHWEMWAIASGGLTPLEAIRTATFTAAEAMGMQQDIGSLEPGKLADLIVLDGNPLVDLEHTNSIRYVMKDGTLWNGDTMDEVWPLARMRPRSMWDASPL